MKPEVSKFKKPLIKRSKVIEKRSSLLEQSESPSRVDEKQSHIKIMPKLTANILNSEETMQDIKKLATFMVKQSHLTETDKSNAKNLVIREFITKEAVIS